MISKNSHFLLEQLIGSLDDPYVLIDQNYVIRFANDTYINMHKGENAHSVIGKKCYEVSHGYQLPCDQSGESCPLSLSRESGYRERVVHIHRRSDRDLYETIELMPLKNEDGKAVYFLERVQPLSQFSPTDQHEGLTGKSSAFVLMLDHLVRVAPTDTTVLIQGESGTGKELVARAIHDSSKRSLKPFVTVDCTGLPESLIESELFGHEKGAFTGAHALKRGLVEEADGGTLFLDEIGDIPIALQAKLLRFLESGSFRRVGSNQLLHSNVRLVSATHRPLKEMVESGVFRSDLYFRISTFPLFVPSLRDRREDLTLLVATLLKRIESTKPIEISKQALKVLSKYHFPGNIRELKNILQRATLLCDSGVIEAKYLPDEVWSSYKGQQLATEDGLVSRLPEENVERLLQTGLTRREMAKKLGLSERTVYRILKSMNRQEA